MYKTLAESIGEMSVSALSNLYVVHINIVGLLKHFDKLELFLNQIPRPVDIICLSKTRLTSDKIAMTNTNGYNFFYCNSPTRAGGSGSMFPSAWGVANCIKTKLIVKGARLFG